MGVLEALLQRQSFCRLCQNVIWKLEHLQGREQLCECGQMIEPGDMFSAHVLPCPHCKGKKSSECTALALEVRAKSSCCESCAMACGSCVRKLRLACSNCHLIVHATDSSIACMEGLEDDPPFHWPLPLHLASL